MIYKKMIGGKMAVLLSIFKWPCCWEWKG